jgi:hypothetical protein
MATFMELNLFTSPCHQKVNAWLATGEPAMVDTIEATQHNCLGSRFYTGDRSATFGSRKSSSNWALESEKGHLSLIGVGASGAHAQIKRYVCCCQQQNE